ncbi:CAP-associated domain-containing protein [Sporosarcina sp. HYO08]|uniref:CAP domain-containing protein n=1 Tax=Sporosarcina sp. HYO08 TaxID=1759557 RepID=UPI0007929B1E|nr:CAP-associated domain-containing protein [Sporosarcina sp. HYO08]KXH80877.1 serine protease [Sporosarcina sp. HYO08]
MRRLFLLALFAGLLYIAKPIWEEPVSKIVDLSFFDTIDEQVNTLLNNQSVHTAVQYIRDTADKAALFISSPSVDQEKLAPDVKIPILEKPPSGEIAIHNIVLGSSEENVRTELGDPQRVSVNEYGTEWETYHDRYHNFVMISFDELRNVNAIYTNDRLISTSAGIQYGSSKSDVRTAFGDPIKEIRKGLHIFILQDSEEYDVFKSGDTYTYVFYDLHKNDTVTAVQLISASLERRKAGIYAGGNDALRKGFEQQLFDLTNAARVRNGLSVLQWDELVSGTARKHSEDMAVKNYFSHTNQEGKSPFDRMQYDGILFSSAGENLAYGQPSSIFAHEGLMNSEGHRKNILQGHFSHLGTGVAFNEKSQPYYTEKFFSK